VRAGAEGLEPGAALAAADEVLAVDGR
jgi:hypothetical protein